ncbi:MAG: UPF0147 family protein [Nanoarchaeota archaeon]
MTALLIDVVAQLEQLGHDPDVSKRVREKTGNVIAVLRENSNLAIDKALLQLEEMESFEMTSYCRTQIWDIASMLESLRN